MSSFTYFLKCISVSQLVGNIDITVFAGVAAFAGIAVSLAFDVNITTSRRAKYTSARRRKENFISLASMWYILCAIGINLVINFGKEILMS